MLTSLIVSMTDIPTPTPNFGGPGVSALLTIVGWVFAICLVVCILGGIISGVAIAIGKAIGNQRVQEGGFGGLVGCLIGVAVCGVIVAVMNFVFHTFGG